MSSSGFLGIDAGTQGLSVVFTDEDLKVIATGDGKYDMVLGTDEGCYEQLPVDWEAALVQAMNDLRSKLSDQDLVVHAIGISGQMHGEVLADAAGNALGTARLWCDGRNEAEGAELSERFGVKIPKRLTAARWLWTVRNRPDKSLQAARITTPAGWLHHVLTGEWTLGIGDASGMFPINQETLDYDYRLLDFFGELITNENIRSLKEMLPAVRRAGEDAGSLSHSGAKLLGLQMGIPVAPAEGDQPAALAGSLIGNAGMVSVSFGTSVCANSVGDRPFKGVSPAVDHFCAPDGKPINMVWLRNGTTFMNSMVDMLGATLGDEFGERFDILMPRVIDAPAHCGGIMALPFMDDEPGLGVSRGGTALLVGFDSENSDPGNAIKAALLSTMFNLRRGSEILDSQGFPRDELILSGGLTKTPKLGQILADVFNTPVTLLQSAEEGTAWGAALLAKYRKLNLAAKSVDWCAFLDQHAGAGRKRFEPVPDHVTQYEAIFERYKKLVSAHAAIDQAVH